MGLKYKLHIPAFLAVVIFAIVMHVFWADSMLQRHKQMVTKDQQTILSTVQLELSRNLVSGDLAAVYEILDSLIDVNDEIWSNLELINAQGKRIYPLVEKELHPLFHIHPEILHLTQVVKWNSQSDALGTLLLDINWKKFEASELERISQLELYAFIIMLLYFFGGIVWNHLIVIRPITKLKAAVKGLKSGVLNTDLGTNRKDELGLLENTFAEMHQQQNSIQKQLQEALNSIWNKEIRHRTIMDNMLEGLVTIDQKGRIDSINKATEDIFGYTAQDLLGTNISLLMPENDAKHHDNHLAKHTTNSKSHVINLSRGVEGRRKDGTTFPMEISVNEVVINNEKFFVGILRDITERKTAERILKKSNERLDYLLSSSRSVIYSCKAEGEFGATYISRNIKEQMGYEADDFTADSSFWANHIHPEDKDKVFEDLSELFEKGHHTHEYRFKHKNGEYIWLHDELRLICDEQGKPIEIIGSWIDVTKRINSERQQLQMQKQLQQAKKMESIGQLTGGFAHDFNNFLASMLGYCELAKEGFSDSDDNLSRYLGEIQTSGKRAQNLVDQLLSLSREESGQQSTMVPTVFSDEIRMIIETMLPSSIELSMSIDDQLSVVEFDSVRTKQLLMTLTLDLSAKIVKQGRIEIKMKLLEPDSHHDLVPEHILTGTSINICITRNDANTSFSDSNDITPYIAFNEFENLDGSELSLINDSINNGGGNLLVRNTQDGSKEYMVIFSLTTQSKIEEKYFSIPSVDLSVVKKSRVLIVDDEASVAIFLAELLETHGYSVSVENNGIAAIENIQKRTQPYDLIISDENMPGMLGSELSRKLHDMNYNSSVILYTESDVRISKDKMIENGITSVLNKPIDVMMLLTSIQQVLKSDSSKSSTRLSLKEN